MIVLENGVLDSFSTMVRGCYSCTFYMHYPFPPCFVICSFGGIRPPKGGFITPKGHVLTRGVLLFTHRGGCYPRKSLLHSCKRAVSIC